MKKISLLSAALAIALIPLAHAQAPSRMPKGNVENTEDQAKKQDKAAKAAAAAAGQEVPMFPNATRVSPLQMSTSKTSKQLAELFALKDSNTNPDELIAKAEAMIANPKANPFDISSANYIASYAWQAKDTEHYTNAIKYVQAAIDANGLSNNTHYQLMFSLAQMLEAEEKHNEALAIIERYLAETKSDDAKAFGLKAQIMLATDKPEAAAQSLEQLLAKKPNDKKLMWNLTTIYSQAGNNAKAGAMLDKMHAAGLFTESKDYDNAFRILANIDGREKDALSLIDEGLSKKILEPNYAVYAFQGQTYYGMDQVDKALDAWNKAAPLAKDGEMYLNVAKLQMEKEHWADAKTAAKTAMDKGVKKPGQAWQVIAQSEQGLHNKPAARAALVEAAKYPETKKWAEGALRQASGK
jgi:hypothetical protein